MVRKVLALLFVISLVAACGWSEAQEKDKVEKKKRTGTVTGELQSRKDTPNGKNVTLEILGAGEEKARPYRVMYDPKIKAPIADVLAAAKAAKIGDRVQADWIDTGEGLALTSFQVLKKSDEKKDKKDDK
jgi:hypothetical protein